MIYKELIKKVHPDLNPTVDPSWSAILNGVKNDAKKVSLYAMKWGFIPKSADYVDPDAKPIFNFNRPNFNTDSKGTTWVPTTAYAHFFKNFYGFKFRVKDSKNSWHEGFLIKATCSRKTLRTSATFYVPETDSFFNYKCPGKAEGQVEILKGAYEVYYYSECSRLAKRYTASKAYNKYVKKGAAKATVEEKIEKKKNWSRETKDVIAGKINRPFGSKIYVMDKDGKTWRIFRTMKASVKVIDYDAPKCERKISFRNIVKAWMEA